MGRNEERLSVGQIGSARSASDRGDAEITLVLMLDKETDVEVKLPGRYKVSPQIAGAIKAVAGVVDVQTL